jgi:hypothetical protein
VFDSRLENSALSRVRKTANATFNFVMYVCPSVRIEQLAPTGKECHQVRYLGIFRKSVEKIQISSKSDKNIYF